MELSTLQLGTIMKYFQKTFETPVVTFKCQLGTQNQYLDLKESYGGTHRETVLWTAALDFESKHSALKPRADCWKYCFKMLRSKQEQFIKTLLECPKKSQETSQRYLPNIMIPFFPTSFNERKLLNFKINNACYWKKTFCSRKLGWKFVFQNRIWNCYLPFRARLK